MSDFDIDVDWFDVAVDVTEMAAEKIAKAEATDGLESKNRAPFSKAADAAPSTPPSKVDKIVSIHKSAALDREFWDLS
jgi:hypothetical protein